ncbi:MAG: hypothetical protein Q9206_005362 [Seirophora lacunosa]
MHLTNNGIQTYEQTSYDSNGSIAASERSPRTHEKDPTDPPESRAAVLGTGLLPQLHPPWLILSSLFTSLYRITLYSQRRPISSSQATSIVAGLGLAIKPGNVHGPESLSKAIPPPRNPESSLETCNSDTLGMMSRLSLIGTNYYTPSLASSSSEDVAIDLLAQDFTSLAKSSSYSQPLTSLSQLLAHSRLVRLRQRHLSSPAKQAQ